MILGKNRTGNFSSSPPRQCKACLLAQIIDAIKMIHGQVKLIKSSKLAQTYLRAGPQAVTVAVVL